MALLIKDAQIYLKSIKVFFTKKVMRVKKESVILRKSVFRKGAYFGKEITIGIKFRYSWNCSSNNRFYSKFDTSRDGRNCSRADSIFTK